MKNIDWRNLAEIIGVVSIVAGLILVAWEVRQANNIAKAQIVLDIAAQANQFNSATYGSSEVAELVAAISDSSHTEFSKAEESKLIAVAWHFGNIFWSAQRAYDSGLLSKEDIVMYRSSLAWHIENHPGLRPTFRKMYHTAPWIRDMFVFQPLVELDCEPESECVDLTADD
jgi:hypothetical protein